MRRWLAVLALTLLTAGCAGTSETDRPPSQQSSAAATTAGELSVADAAKRYLEIVAPYNSALEDLKAAGKAGESWPALRTRAGKVAQANEQHGKALREVNWPAQARAPMAALLTEIDAAQPHWVRASQAKSSDEFAAAVGDAAEHSGSKAAGEVRAALGLPAYSG